ncbi:MAG: DUF3566 domain-containing protein [Acidimicrobiales bacterium]
MISDPGRRTRPPAVTAVVPAAGAGAGTARGRRPGGVPGPKARRVRQRIRRVETKTVLLFSFLLYLGLFVVFLVAGILVWEAAVAVGAIHHLQHFAVTLGFSPLHHLGSRLLHFAVYAGLVLVGIGTVVNVILAVVYNLVSDIVGGIGVVVEERETPRRRVGRQGPRRPVV